MTDPPRNVVMAQRIERTPVAYPFRFVVAGDSGAWPDPTAEAIYAQLVRQVAALDPQPLFFANLGDFAGPGTSERHEHYLRLVDSCRSPTSASSGTTTSTTRAARTRSRASTAGGGGSGLCSHYRGICAAGPARPEDRGSLYHAVEITIGEEGGVSRRVIQAFAPVGASARFGFGA